jgi:hypothetical protein
MEQQTLKCKIEKPLERKTMNTQTVNFKLVELLKQTIDTLSSAEKNMLRSHLLHPAALESDKYSAIDIIMSSPGQQMFQTPEEADQYIQAERDSWDS